MFVCAGMVRGCGYESVWMYICLGKCTIIWFQTSTRARKRALHFRINKSTNQNVRTWVVHTIYWPLGSGLWERLDGSHPATTPGPRSARTRSRLLSPKHTHGPRKIGGGWRNVINHAMKCDKSCHDVTSPRWQFWRRYRTRDRTCCTRLRQIQNGCGNW